jgi:hypothetical protein
VSNYALRIPDSLFEYAKKCAEEDNVSMNQFFVMAIAEKVSALKTAEFFRERTLRGDRDRFAELMGRVRDVPPAAGDEVEDRRKQAPVSKRARSAAPKRTVRAFSRRGARRGS